MVNSLGKAERLPSLPSPLQHAPAHPPVAAKQSEGGAGEPSWGEVLSSRAARLGVMLFLFQQFSGINAIVYFSSSGESLLWFPLLSCSVCRSGLFTVLEQRQCSRRLAVSVQAGWL